MNRKVILLGATAVGGLLWMLRKKTEPQQPPAPPSTTPAAPPESSPVPPSSGSGPGKVTWAPTSDQRQGIADIAENELGAKTPSKYWQKVLDGEPQPKHSWCGAFALWVLRTAGITRQTYDPNGSWFMQLLKPTTSPQPGDVAWFEPNRHVGMVVKTSTDGQTLQIVDGAGTGGAVSTRTIPKSKATGFYSIARLLQQKASPTLPGGWTRMAQADVTPEMVAYAQQALKTAGPIGNVQTATIDGKPVAAWTEWHYDEARGQHKGITLLERET